MGNIEGYPLLGFGLGLRAPHYEHVLRERPKLDWFEIISENFLDAHAGYWEFLADLRRDYAFVMHGVSLSIGGLDPLDRGYLAKLKRLAQFLQPAWISDHLCFTGLGGHNTHDLLPLPYTEATLTHIVARIREVQDYLERPIVLENPSSYVEFASSTMPEWEFMARMAEKSGCGILLDVNNIYVSSFNHGFDPKTYIEAIPAQRIAQIHLAGHLNKGTHIIDTHDDHVIAAVWSLYEEAIRTKGFRSTMIEWDDKIPSFAQLDEELDKARAIVTRVRDGRDAAA